MIILFNEEMEHEWCHPFDLRKKEHVVTVHFLISPRHNTPTQAVRNEYGGMDGIFSCRDT